MRKAQGYFVGGRRGFGFDVVGGKKVPNEVEQKLIEQMRVMRSAGKSLLSIHRWLNEEQGVKLAYSSLRSALLGLLADQMIESLKTKSPFNPRSH